MAESSPTNPVNNEETEKLDSQEKTSPSPPLTQSSEDNNSKSASSFTGSWFSSFVNVAKQKSSKTLEFMKRDLTEFRDTVQQNTSAAITTTTSYIGETVSQLTSPKEEETSPENVDENEPEPEPETTSESRELIPSPAHHNNGTKQKEAAIINYLSSKAKSIFSSIVDVMIPHEYEDDDDICFVKGNRIVSIERGRWDLLMKTIQSDPQTYCHEPEGAPEDYENWLASFNLIDHDYKVQQLLSMEDEVVKGFYDKLVPHSITPDEFWHRYFYKVHQLKQVEFQRLAAKAEEQERQEKAEREKEKTEKESTPVTTTTSSTNMATETIKLARPQHSRNNSNTNMDKKASPIKELEGKTLLSSINSSLVSSTSIISSTDTLVEAGPTAGGDSSKVTSGGVSPASDSTKQSDGSEEWVKTEMMDDIVIEAMKKLDTKLTDNPNLKVKEDEDDDMLYDWDSS